MKLGLLGLIVGVLSAGMGVGGGAIMVPTLISLFKFDFPKAAGTSLATIIPISLVGAAGHIFLSGHVVPIGHCVTFIPAAAIGAVIGGLFLKAFNTHLLKAVFGIFILISGIKMLGLYDFSFLFFGLLKTLPAWLHFFCIFAFGLCAGFISSMLGVGCGLIIVPFFVVFVGLDIHSAITLSLVSMFFLTITATAVYKRSRVLDGRAILGTVPAALAGAVIGVLLSGHLSAAVLKKGFGVFLLAMAMKFLLDEAMYVILGLRGRESYEQR